MTAPPVTLAGQIESLLVADRAGDAMASRRALRLLSASLDFWPLWEDAKRCLYWRDAIHGRTRHKDELFDPPMSYSEADERVTRMADDAVQALCALRQP